VPSSNNLVKTYNEKISKYMDLSTILKSQWNLEKKSILPFILSCNGLIRKSSIKNINNFRIR